MHPHTHVNVHVHIQLVHVLIHAVQLLYSIHMTIYTYLHVHVHNASLCTPQCPTGIMHMASIHHKLGHLATICIPCNVTLIR